MSDYSDRRTRRWLTDTTAFGFVLQDLVNEVGRPLGFTVTFGMYRGRGGADSPDGIWAAQDGRVLLVESKTSCSHRNELAKLAEWRRRLAVERHVSDETVSSLMVIAEEETEELEAQVRGSRSAWELRLLGVDALFKLLSIRESLDDDQVERQTQSILIPREFTRLDKIIDLVFATKEDAAPPEDVTGEEAGAEQEPRTQPGPPAHRSRGSSTSLRNAETRWVVGGARRPCGVTWPHRHSRGEPSCKG